MKPVGDMGKRKYAAASYLLSWISGVIMMIWKGTEKEPYIRWHAVQSTAYGLIVLCMAIAALVVAGSLAYFSILIAGWLFGVFVAYVVYRDGEFRIPLAYRVANAVTR